MSRLATSFVLGYHGCDEEVAHKAVLEGASILKSDRDYDWLGPGAYFWEADPRRALEWAEWKAKRGDYNNPTVVGAAIDLRHCLDLVSREDIALLHIAYDSFAQLQAKSDLPMPQNTSPADSGNEDLLLRYLDCAILRHLHVIVGKSGLEPFDTVRGMFIEGGSAFPGSGIKEKSHVQIAVINDDCIKGVFFPAIDGNGQFR